MLRLVAALLFAVLTVTGCSSGASDGAPAAAKTALTASEFKTLIAQPGVKLIDVRTPAEFASGHLPDAVNIDIEASDFDTRIAQLPKDASYALYCRSGNRSGQALTRLTASGFKQVAHLSGGIVAWQTAGLPVVT